MGRPTRSGDGSGLSEKEILDIGERALALAKLFNEREGLGAASDALPPQVTKPHVSGVLSKVRLDPDDLLAQVRSYYAARGWSEDGHPLPATLQRLGIAEYVRD